jgi:hypothetical protein
MATYYHTCPNQECQNEIAFDVEFVTADDGEWYQAVRKYK